MFSDADNEGHAEQIVKAINDFAALKQERDALRLALIRLRDCDWVITPADRMDAVRDECSCRSRIPRVEASICSIIVASFCADCPWSLYVGMIVYLICKESHRCMRREVRQQSRN